MLAAVPFPRRLRARGGDFPIPCAEELRMLLRVFGRFVAHDMGDVIPEAEKQGGVCPLEKTV